ncbi:hypothetical protein RB195_024121 [Necator americanus]|uniref:Zinc finger PHD-type domain-containing protein n=1 Tax=Necator americanus TaxID=51031 RepID=A0ABR1EM07_NECAM
MRQGIQQSLPKRRVRCMPLCVCLHLSYGCEKWNKLCACSCSSDVHNVRTPFAARRISSVFDGEVENENNGQYSSDGDEEMMEVVVEDDVENESVARSSTDVEDRHKDMFQRMEMMYASARESMLKVMKEPTEGTGMEIEQNVGRNGDTTRLARRHDVPSVGCPQALTPIRKLHKRAHLRKAEEAKRKPVLDIPDCAQDERDACAVCLRMQPITGSTNHRICWIQCPTCEEWMHTDCISNNVCPRDGAELRRSDV